MGIDCRLPSGGHGLVAGGDAAQAARTRSPGAEAQPEEGGFSSLMALWEAPPADADSTLEPALPAELLAQTLPPWGAPMATPTGEGGVPAAGGGPGAAPAGGRGVKLLSAAVNAQASQDEAGAPAGRDDLSLRADAAETLPPSGATAGLVRLRPGEGLAARKGGGIEATDDSRLRLFKAEMSDAGAAGRAAAEAAPELPAALAQWEQAFARHAGAESGPGQPILSAGGGEHGSATRPEGGDLAARPDAAPQADAPLQKQLSEQVSYWLGRHVQNAELTLEGPGRSAVEVSIALQGKEAHVEFRSDQWETREALEGAVAQLREQLRADGLVLVGVSVGHSDARQAKSQGRRVAEKARAAGVAQAPEVLSGTVRAATLPAGRRLDLYV